MRLEPVTLEDRFVRLRPYAGADREGVRQALDGDPEAWALFSRAGFGDRFDAWWSEAEAGAERGESVNFAVRDLARDRVVGSTSYLGISTPHRHVEIGATFLHADMRGGPVNPAIKRLMLGHAFAAGAVRVSLVTDARNLRSQAAIAKLGAVREGVLRREKITWTGHVRDTVVFSILAEEWPEVRQGLDARIAAF